MTGVPDEPDRPDHSWDCYAATPLVVHRSRRGHEREQWGILNLRHGEKHVCEHVGLVDIAMSLCQISSRIRSGMHSAGGIMCSKITLPKSSIHCRHGRTMSTLSYGHYSSTARCVHRPKPLGSARTECATCHTAAYVLLFFPHRYQCWRWRAHCTTRASAEEHGEGGRLRV